MMTARRAGANDRARLPRKLVGSQVLWMRMLSPEQRLLFRVLASNETISASGHSTFRIILTNWKVPGVAILVDEGHWCHREIEETENILPRRKILRLIMNEFKCHSCCLEIEEVDLIWVNPRGRHYEWWVKVIENDISAPQKGVCNQESAW